jgi:hypothetical protein
MNQPVRQLLCLKLSQNFHFGFEKSTIVHPSRLFEYCKAIFFVSTPHGLPSTPAQPKIAPFVAYFCNTSPYPNPAVDRFHCCPGHQLSIPSVAVAPRSGPASLRTAADSDVLPPAEASGSGHVSPAAPPVFTSRCCKLVSDQFSILCGSASRRHRFPKL